MKRILFVDDEPHVLDGLRRLLRGMRHEWEMHFAPSGAEALDRLRRQAFDVVVSDMRMPTMDGATLLRTVQREFPRTIRLALSGQIDPHDALRAASVAHQFLSKPCHPELLAEAVGRACDLEGILSDPSLQAAIGGIDHLPSVPRVYSELTQALGDPNASLGTVVEIVGRDIAISAKVLQIGNSAFFGLPRKVTDLHAAVSVLGMATLRNLVLSVGVFEAYSGATISRRSLDAMQRHGFACGCVARSLLADKRLGEDAFVAGLLHDVGRLVLAMPSAAAAASAAHGAGRVPPAAEPRAVLDHARVGAYLLGLWGLPSPIVEAVAYHHAPRAAISQQFGVLGAVHVANTLVHELAGDPRDGGEAWAASVPLDIEYLERVGLVGELDHWRELAAERLRIEQS